MKFCKLVFKSIILAILISGLSSFVISINDIDKLNCFIRGKARKIMRGMACTKDKGKYKSLPNADIHRFIGIANIDTELRVMRLKWYQSICETPLDFEQFLTAVYSDFNFQCSGDNTSHPWRQRIH